MSNKYYFIGYETKDKKKAGKFFCWADGDLEAKNKLFRRIHNARVLFISEYGNKDEYEKYEKERNTQ